MNGRKQKISKDSWRQNDRTESEGYDGALTNIGMTEECVMELQFVQEGMLEQILSPRNLTRAYRQVVRNKGSAGIDGMATRELKPWLETHREELLKSLYDGTYKPKPVKRVEIPKENGRTRQLGIPTVVDRYIQQAITQVLTLEYDETFSNRSYGFRPNRNAQQAVKEACTIINAGNRYAVDIDLEKFFDTVSQSKLIEKLSKKIKDSRVISLIHKYLRAGVMANGTYETNETGVPQGSPLSPLLGNIVLDELDKELEERGHPFVRYADDSMIFCKSRRAAERIKASITRYIETSLYLRVNREKSRAGAAAGVKFLGYSFYYAKGECRLSVHRKSLKKLRVRLKELTARNNGMSYERRKNALKVYIRGWVEYYKKADVKTALREMDKWLRRRIRMCIWKSWKRTKTKCANLIRCGIDKRSAWMWANTRKGYWRIANSPIIDFSISSERLRKAGYVLLSETYANLATQT